MVCHSQKVFEDAVLGAEIPQALLMEHSILHTQAIRYLANKYNIEIEETEQTDQKSHH
jgi:hypothetical protein